jgi:hypothetical protein
MDYTMWGITIELDLYKQETLIVLCITWSLDFYINRI